MKGNQKRALVACAAAVVAVGVGVGVAFVPDMAEDDAPITHTTATQTVSEVSSATTVQETITQESTAIMQTAETEPVTTEPFTTSAVTAKPVTTRPIATRPVTTRAVTTVRYTTRPALTTTVPKTTAPKTTEVQTTKSRSRQVVADALDVARYVLDIEKRDQSAETTTTTTTQPVTQAPLPASAKISDVPYLNQIDLGYPMGCEAVSGTMLLRYYGYDVTAAQMVAAVPTGKGKYQVDGVWYAADPFEEFVGDPRKTLSQGSYGCFAKPLAEGMRKFAGDRVKNISGCSVDDLFRHIAEGRPVVVWGASNGVTLTKDVTWQCVDKKGNPTGKTFQQITREHCMVLIGYDKNYVYLNNPSSKANVAQDKSVFISNWKTLYSQAIIII